MPDATPPQGGAGARAALIALQQVFDRVAELADGVMVAVQPAIERFATQALIPARDWLQVNGPAVAAAMIAMKKFAAEANVENWGDLDQDEWVAALELMCADDGVPIAWIPPIAVVKAILAAPDHPTRNEVLLDHADAIAADCRRALSAVTHPELAILHKAVAEAWNAWDAGLCMPAQAQAAAAVSGIVELNVGSSRFVDFRMRWERFRKADPQRWDLSALRVTAVMCSLSTALQGEGYGCDDVFNRHSTAHRIDPKQYTPANALRGLMLATSGLRELQFALAEEWMTKPGFVAPPHVKLSQLPGGAAVLAARPTDPSS